mgnify:CR=1 FL=1
MITQEEVQHIAKLARLGLTEKEVEKFQKDLSSILDYFEKLKEVDISKIEPTSHSLKVENVMRNDEVQSTKPEVRKKIMDLAPETKEEYLKVKSVF